MALVRCPMCHGICGDFPDVAGTEPDGTAIDDCPCFECTLDALGDPDDAA